MLRCKKTPNTPIPFFLLQDIELFVDVVNFTLSHLGSILQTWTKNENGQWVIYTLIQRFKRKPFDNSIKIVRCVWLCVHLYLRKNWNDTFDWEALFWSLLIAKHETKYRMKMNFFLIYIKIYTFFRLIINIQLLQQKLELNFYLLK